MPWLSHISLGFWRIGLVITYSNSSPNGLDVPVRRACFPSTLSMVEYLQSLLAQCHECAVQNSYIHMPNAKL